MLVNRLKYTVLDPGSSTSIDSERPVLLDFFNQASAAEIVYLFKKETQTYKKHDKMQKETYNKISNIHAYK